MKPIVHGLENIYPEQVDFVYLNIDDPATDEAKQKYGFRYQPHFLLIDENGEVVQEWIGSVNQGDFRVAIDTILSN
ncbi:MAG: thioredoxin family protein [Anaerolineales bacterium]|nr:thioredoxin family protein [Anaerolineales bacterium]